MDYRRNVFIGTIVAAILGGLCALTPPTAAASSLPSVVAVPAGSGLHGYPYDAAPTTPAIPEAPFIDLSALGYVEQEFIMSGGATVYGQSGLWLSNGAWKVKVQSTNVPYTTRLLVRYPTNPANFNGTVVFEWLNDTTGGDQDPVWSQIYGPLLAGGFAYVGVTAQTVGMSDLKTWDSQRYGSLGDSNDGQSYDIFTQAANVVKSNSATVLGGLTPKILIGTGDSQSAFRIVTYVDAVQPVTHAFNGFMLVGRAVTAAPIGSGLISASPFPALIRTDSTAPLLQINTQGDILELDAGVSRQSDFNYLRTWELAGASHIDTHEAAYEIETIYREQPTVAVPQCALGTPIEGTGTVLDGINQGDSMPLFELEDAGIVALQKWLTTGVQPPHGSLISTTPFFGLYDIVNVDSHGNALGGIRLPEMQVPTDFYSPINFSTVNFTNFNPVQLLAEAEGLFTLLETGGITDAADRASGLCLLSGYFLSFSNTTLVNLYGTNAAYVSDYINAANASVAAGFLTPADAAAAIAKVEATTTIP